MSAKSLEPWPIADFAHFCCGLGPEGKLAMLVAYFDESGTDGGASEVTTVAGFLGRTCDWIRAEEAWKKRLKPLTCFHATDCQAQDKDFRGFTKQESANLFRDLANIIADQKLTPIGGSFYKDDWKYGATEFTKKYLTDRFHPASLLAVLTVREVVKKHAPGESSAFVFAGHQQFNGFITDTFNTLKNDLKWDGIGSLAFGDPKCIVPLQIADLYAYETNRELRRQFKESQGAFEPQREAFKIIHAALPNESRVATPDMLDAIAREEVSLGIK